MHYQIKIELLDVEPPIWRRVLVPSEFTLFDLHQVIQTAMGWEDCHLHDFTIKQQRYTTPDPDDFDDPRDERETRLCDVVRSRSKFSYLYDFGDDWNHWLSNELSTTLRLPVLFVSMEHARARLKTAAAHGAMQTNCAP
jgi:pRiA4b ORF-3-like protein